MKKVIKLIDYCFQHDFQLAEAYDDSNTVDGLCDDFEMILIGRLDIKHKLEKRICEDKILRDKTFKVFFLNKQSNPDEMIELIKTIAPDVIHFHGNHGWPQYPYYADVLRNFFGNGIKMIFSPAGTSCGTEPFLAKFNKVVVNHPDQVKRMRCPENKVIVRRRAIHPVFEDLRSRIIAEDRNFVRDLDYIYVAGIVPQKRIDIFLDFAHSMRDKLFIIAGDETRSPNYFHEILNIW
jgi:glycosyltransferase involved in cell wall biosynthesis